MWVISIKMHPKCDIEGQISKLLYHYLFYVILILVSVLCHQQQKSFFCNSPLRNDNIPIHIEGT